MIEREKTNEEKNRLDRREVILAIYRGVILGMGGYNMYRFFENDKKVNLALGIGQITSSLIGPRIVRRIWSYVEPTTLGNFLTKIFIDRITIDTSQNIEP